jgi:hypothetical protein
MTLLTGTLLAHGRRTVAVALRAKGLAQATDWSLCASRPQPSTMVSPGSESSAAPAHRRDLFSLEYFSGIFRGSILTELLSRSICRLTN